MKAELEGYKLNSIMLTVLEAIPSKNMPVKIIGLDVTFRRVNTEMTNVTELIAARIAAIARAPLLNMKVQISQVFIERLAWP